MSVDLVSSKPTEAGIGGNAALTPIAGARRHRRRRSCENVRKRQQIIRGAREVFLRSGFDAASTEDLARAAGVSKGTLYLYFENKEHLFRAVCQATCESLADPEIAIREDGCSLREALIGCGLKIVTALCRPDRVALLRMLIGTAGRMPEIGQHCYEAAVRPPIARLANLLARQVAAGALAIADCELAAEQFVHACRAPLLTPMILGTGAAPPPERVRQVVSSAADCFLGGYARSTPSHANRRNEEPNR